MKNKKQNISWHKKRIDAQHKFLFNCHYFAVTRAIIISFKPTQAHYADNDRLCKRAEMLQQSYCHKYCYNLLEIVFVKYLVHIFVNRMKMKRRRAIIGIAIRESLELNFSILKNDIERCSIKRFFSYSNEIIF